MTREAQLEARSLDDLERWRLSAATRRASDHHAALRIDTSNLHQVVDSTPEPAGPLEKIDLIVEYLARRSPAFGERVQVPSEDYPVAVARGAAEFNNLLMAMHSLDYVESESSSMVTMKIRGWERAVQLRATRPLSTKAFVAMWFDRSLDAAWNEGFKPGLTTAGYTPLRVDREEHLGKIDDFIIASIRNSSLLVADFTGHRGGVYFEAGFALGLGIPVIWTCRADCIQDAHFDTRQYNHIVWSDTGTLRQQLMARIEATIPNRPGTRTA